MRPSASIIPLLCMFVLGSTCFAQALPRPLAVPANRVIQTVDDSRRITLAGNTHPLTAKAPSTEVDPQTPMEQMVLTLKGDDTQEANLRTLIEQQQNPASPLYHRFLRPNDFGAQFGVSAADINRIEDWLKVEGFHVQALSPGNRAIIFSGTAGQVAHAFHTDIRNFATADGMHLANASDPQIPLALSPVVGGIVKLHDFRHARHISKLSPLGKGSSIPDFTSGSSHYLSPADYATIYDLSSLYAAGNTGTGQSIAIVARSNISLTDVASFRQSFSLPANNPSIIVANQDPGVVDGDADETTLDAEWSGALAPTAAVKVVIASSTNSADGVDLSALYAVSHNVAPVVSLSYGSCEAAMGSAELSFYNSLWQQAAAQGQSVIVSAGDSGAAACDSGSQSSASVHGVNGLCSSPYSTCVGGTEFVEGNNPGQYWYAGNNGAYGSAISYIPETVWNESGANGGGGLWAGGGGSSSYFAKPAWQNGPGVPNDGARDVPDVSLTAAAHDGYVIVEYGNMYVISGTSASAPAFAGLLALVDQKIGSSQGSPNPNLYALAKLQANGGASVFHDISTGNNSVPGLTGFSATAGYDRASGLGSVDGALLLAHWTDPTTSAMPKLTLTASSNTVAIHPGNGIQVTLTSQASALNAPVNLTASASVAGLSGTLASAVLPAPGSGSLALNISAVSSLPAGTYSLTIVAQGGGLSTATTLAVVVTVPSFGIATNAPGLTVPAGSSAQLTVQINPKNGFNNSVSLALLGAPAGVTAAFSPASLSGAASAASTLSISVGHGAAPGAYSLTLVASSGNLVQTTPVILTIPAAASCTLNLNPGRMSLLAGSSASGQLSCGAVSGYFTSRLTFSVSGQPAGVSANLATASIPAGASDPLTLTAASSVSPGTFNLVIQASAPGFTQTLNVPVTISSPATFAVTASQSSITLKAGATGQTAVVASPSGGFNSSISLSVTGLPVGVSASFARPTLTNGSGTSALGFAVGPKVAPGSYVLHILASGGGITRAVQLTLVVTAAPDFAFAVNTSSLTLQAGGAPGTLSVSTGNFTGGFHSSITITFTGLPAGVSYGALGTATANSTVNMSESLSAGAATPPGTYPVIVTAAGGGVAHSATVNITVKPSTVGGSRR